MEYIVPFLCADKDMKASRKALGYYIENLLSADKFDIESAMPTIRDFIRKDKDVLETNVPTLVKFLGRVGPEKIRKPTDSVQNPTKWFCGRLSNLIRSINPTDYFLERLGYGYIEADICHKWVQAFLDYKGPHRKNLLRYMTYAINDAFKDKEKRKKTIRIFYNVYDKISNPENLPISIYLALLECRRTYTVKDWLKFTRTNIDFGRDRKENGRCLRLLINMMFKRLETGCVYEERKSIFEGLRIISRTNESRYLSKCLYRKMFGISSRSGYVELRELIKDKDFLDFSKTVHKKVDPKISRFVKAYEHPKNEILFKSLSWEEKLIIFDRLDGKKKKEIKDKCLLEFDRYLDFSYCKKELFYMFKILSNDKGFINRHAYDERLFIKSMDNSRFRIMYLEKMHALDDKRLLKNEDVHTDRFHVLSSNFGIALLPSRSKNGKVKEYRCVIMTARDEGQSIICEALTKKPRSRMTTYSAVKYNGKGVPKSLYPNITKRTALLFAQKILSNVRQSVPAIA